MTARSLAATGFMAALGLVLAATPGLCEKPRLYMAWHAPYGSPRATDTLGIQPGDGGVDSLYMTFEMPADTNQFVGIESEVLFRAPAGQPLSPHWQGDQMLSVQLSVDSLPGCARASRGVQTMSFAYYDNSVSSGRLRLSNMRPPQIPVTVKGNQPYFYALLLFKHPEASVPNGSQPVCIEWSKAQFVIDTTAATSVMAGPGGRPFVSWNSPGGVVCAPFTPALPPQAPPAKPAAGVKKKRK